MRSMLLAMVCVSLTCRGARAASESQANILVAGSITSVPGGIASIGRFDRQGESLGRFGDAPGTYVSVATYADTIYVAELEGVVKRFSRNGDFLGDLGIRFGFGTNLETDSRGALYASGIKLHPDGTIAQVFSHGSLVARASDADLAGNVYIEGFTTPIGSGASGLYKFDSVGNMLGFVPHAPNRPTATPDMAIDEIGKVMYLRDGQGVLEAYDISGPLPVLSRVIPTPGPIIGLSFDSASRHLFVTQEPGLRAWELDLDGTPLRRFRLNADEGSFLHVDIAVIAVPEPNALFLGIFAAALPILRPRR